MIKKLILIAAVFTIAVSCNNSKNKKEGKKVSKRDYSINKSNAYNEHFFDSLKLVEFLTNNQVDEDISRRMTSFYNTRNYQFAWFGSTGLTEQARGFWNLHRYHTTYANDSVLNDKKLEDIMQRYTEDLDGFAVSVADKNIINTELTLTQHFILYALNNYEKGVLKRKEMERFIPRKKEEAMALADSLINKKHKDDKYYGDANIAYGLLKEKLKIYVNVAKAGGWPQVPVTAVKLKNGSTAQEILTLKKRLHLTGDMAADSTAVFNDGLTAGIKNFQLRYGYKPTGIITENLIKDMNVPVIHRIQQILLNMGRMQWMVNEPEGKMIVVNIPEFILHVKDGKQKIFDMVVVVGKEGHNTVMFTGDLNQVVFSPYWNLPPSIVKNEIIPAMNANPDYLASHNMEITGTNGDLPVIRQLPGGSNSLGKVKFLFPNSFNIYFHDTPAKALFERDKRAYSHGCIRLSDPAKMANYLLKDDAEWPPAKIEAAMNSGEEKYVKLKKPVPVLITYYTAWVDDNGLLHFAEDIYDHDKHVMSKMFINRS